MIKLTYIFIIFILVMLFGLAVCFRSDLKAEDTQMQTVIKVDPITNGKIQFFLKLYTLQNLDELIPSVGQHKDPAARADKYIFCIVKNLSKCAISIKFKIVSSNAVIGSWSPEITMRWFSSSDVGIGNQQYALVWLGNPSFGMPDHEVKLDVEILELDRK